MTGVQPLYFDWKCDPRYHPLRPHTFPKFEARSGLSIFKKYPGEGPDMSQATKVVLGTVGVAVVVGLLLLLVIAGA